MTIKFNPIFETREIDVHALKTGIFFSDASLFAPVAVTIDKDTYPQEPHKFFQSLEDCCNGGKNESQIKLALSRWGTYAGVVGVGQYSLSGKSALALARFDIVYRNATHEEVRHDLNNFGEQVTGDEWDSVDEATRSKNILVSAWGTKYIYTGPLRIDKFIFNTLIREQVGLPKDITTFVREIDERSVKNELTVIRAFHSFYGKNGYLDYVAFAKPEDYSPDKWHNHGTVSLGDGKLLWTPAVQGASVVDFTQELVRHDI